VETRALVQAAKRNVERFPRDFMFRLSLAELANLKSQTVILSWGGSRRSRPYAFTEQGVLAAFPDSWRHRHGRWRLAEGLSIG
jgi:hypothetical protein